MNEPIVSPWLVYLISRLDAINQTIFLALIVNIMLIFIFTMRWNENRYEEDRKKYGRYLKKSAYSMIVLSVLLTFTPSKNDAIAVYIASKVTPANIQTAGEIANNSIDKVIEKIIKILNDNPRPGDRIPDKKEVKS